MFNMNGEHSVQQIEKGSVWKNKDRRIWYVAKVVAANNDLVAVQNMYSKYGDVESFSLKDFLNNFVPFSP